MLKYNTPTSSPHAHIIQFNAFSPSLYLSLSGGGSCIDLVKSHLISSARGDKRFVHRPGWRSRRCSIRRRMSRSYRRTTTRTPTWSTSARLPLPSRRSHKKVVDFPRPPASCASPARRIASKSPRLSSTPKGIGSRVLHACSLALATLHQVSILIFLFESFRLNWFVHFSLEGIEAQLIRWCLPSRKAYLPEAEKAASFCLPVKISSRYPRLFNSIAHQNMVLLT